MRTYSCAWGYVYSYVSWLGITTRYPNLWEAQINSQLCLLRMWLCVYGAWKEPEGSMIFLRHIWETFHDILTFSWQTQWHFIVFSVMKTY